MIKAWQQFRSAMTCVRTLELKCSNRGTGATCSELNFLQRHNKNWPEKAIIFSKQNVDLRRVNNAERENFHSCNTSTSTATPSSDRSSREPRSPSAKNDNAFLAVDDVATLQAAADRLSPQIIQKQLAYWTLILRDADRRTRSRTRRTSCSTA